MRELENFVKRYLVMGDESLALSELQAGLRRRQVPVEMTPEHTVTLDDTVPGYRNGEEHGRNLKFLVHNLKVETEIQAIVKALAETNWNRKRAARLLNISYRGLLYKISQHGITRLNNSAITPHFRNGSAT